MLNPWEMPFPDHPAERILDSIRMAYTDHNKRDECHPKEPE